MSKRPCSSQASKSEIEIKRQKRSNSSPSNEVSADDKVVLNVLLNCEETKSSETKQVHFQSLPTTPLEIKKKIEEDFSIPSCVQTLHYQSMILKDSDQLQHTHFRSGDTVTIDYPIEAECEVVQKVIKWLKELLDLLNSIKENISSLDIKERDLLMSSNIHKIKNLVQVGDRNGIIANLSVSLFDSCGDKVKETNRFYFQQEGGLDTLMKVYSILVSREWGDLGMDKMYHGYLEGKCSLAVCNYIASVTIAFRSHVIRLGGLEMCTTTLLRRRLRRGDNIHNTTIYNTLHHALFAILK